MKYEEYIQKRHSLEEQLIELDKEARLLGPIFLIIEKKYGPNGSILLETRTLSIADPTCKVNEEHLLPLAVGQHYLFPEQICYVRIK